MNDTPVIFAEDFDVESMLSDVSILKCLKGRKYPKSRKTGNRYRYLDIVTAFDIETSKHRYGDSPTDWYGWMYIWQWQFGDMATVIGRTWESFLDLVNHINAYLPPDVRLMVYVHNLAYEFQFISGIWHFSEDDLFATDVRAPLYCLMGSIEFRCSYRLSNYSLEKWAAECGVDHRKMVGDLDYSIERYPWTILSDAELRYCINDVIVVVECVIVHLQLYGDNLYTIPYTNTGYVRRRVKAALRLWSPDAVKDMCGDLREYDRLRDAFRGGVTHANRWRVRDIIADVYSYDRSSSYPDVIVHCKFPMSKFREESPSIDRMQILVNQGRAVLVKIAFWHIRLRNDKNGLPYIPIDKTRRPGYTYPIHVKEDNGSILSADYCELAMTDLDFEIISKQYVWDDINVQWMMSARYGYLPRPLVDVVIDLYKRKTALKGIAGSEVNYNHSKAELNSVYGMMVQRVIGNPIKYINDHWLPDDKFDRESAYNEAIQKSFLAYQWGVWVTAWARYRLQEGVNLAEKLTPYDGLSAFVYADTDSVKATAPVDFERFNRRRIQDALSSGAWANDVNGVTHYMGVFESEGKYDLFRTLGAKRYCYMNGNELKITVAGVPKEEGSKELSKRGGIEAFDFDLVFRESGKHGAVYKDDIDTIINIDGHELRITRCVSLVDVEYSMTASRNYSQLLEEIDEVLDNYDYTDYNRKW